MDLIMDCMINRAKETTPTDLRTLIGRFDGPSAGKTRQDISLDEKRRCCYMCQNGNKHPLKCSVCDKGICHANIVD
ncbi:hypothetical protein JTB14_027175 [Gonioctena quinquepunctata]|nr:hypothetical protein JTB14_027175 [Gonioctena quinquepunctata]